MLYDDLADVISDSMDEIGVYDNSEEDDDDDIGGGGVVIFKLLLLLLLLLVEEEPLIFILLPSAIVTIVNHVQLKARGRKGRGDERRHHFSQLLRSAP